MSSINNIINSLFAFVNTNKSSFTAEQIHAFMSSIHNMKDIYNKNVVSFKTEMTETMNNINNNINHIEKTLQTLGKNVLEIKNEVSELTKNAKCPPLSVIPEKPLEEKSLEDDTLQINIASVEVNTSEVNTPTIEIKEK